jgi:hypothetical protein
MKADQCEKISRMNTTGSWLASAWAAVGFATLGGGDFCSPALAQDETKPAVEEAAVAATHNHFLT